MLQQVHGDKYPDPEVFTKDLVLRPKIRVPGLLYYPYLTIKGLLKAIGWLLFYGLYRFGYVSIPAFLLTVPFLIYDWRIGAAFVLLVVLGLGRV